MVTCQIKVSVPVVGQQAVAQDEPSPLVSLDVVGPLEQPALVGVSGRRSGRFGLRHHASPRLQSGLPLPEEAKTYEQTGSVNPQWRTRYRRYFITVITKELIIE